MHRPHALPGTDENGLGLWQKLIIYTSESATHNGQTITAKSFAGYVNRKSSRGATAITGIWGFHGDHAPHGDHLFELARRGP